jgi:hypothetical protein
MMVESGFMKDMLTLHERLPVEVVLWSLEHRISTSVLLMAVAFEKCQNRAYIYSELVGLSFVYFHIRS